MVSEKTILVFMVVLVLLAGVQTFQVMGLNSAISSGGISVGSGSSSASSFVSSAGSSGNGGGDVPSLLQDIPSQVGGC